MDVDEKMETSELPVDEDASDKSSDSSDSSSEDSDAPADEEKSIENREKIKALEKEIVGNPMAYTAQVTLIDLLREEGMVEQLKAARERMYQTFPLTEAIWKAWIVDASMESVEAADKEKARADMYSLHEKAIGDYLSIDLWLEYAASCVGGVHETEGGESVCRSLFERAVEGPAGWHMAKGHMVWETYREFEVSMLSVCQERSTNEEINGRLIRIESIYERQLTRPLMYVEKARAEWKQWKESESGDQVDKEQTDRVEAAYTVALKELNRRRAYERALEEVKDDKENLVACRKYLSFELKEENTNLITSLYERILSKHCLYADIWVDYTVYLEKLKVSSETILSVYRRALRNCPWYAGLWVNWLRAAEKAKLPYEEILELVQKALGGGYQDAASYLQVWCAYCDYMRRRVPGPSEQVDDNSEHSGLEISDLEATFAAAIEYMLEHFGEEGDPDCIIPKYYAEVEVKYCKNVERARAIWNELLTGKQRYRAQMWLEFAQFERSHGDYKHQQKVYLRALKVEVDDPVCICSEFVRFQREQGTLDQLYQAEARAKDITDQHQAKHGKPAQTFHQGQDKKVPPSKDKKFPPSKDKKFPPSKDKKFPPSKEKKYPPSKDNKDHEGKAGSKRPRQPEPEKQRSGKMKPGAGPPQSKKSKAEELVEQPENSKALEQSHSDPAAPQYFPERTVFVSNLNFNTDEDELRAALSPCGKITDIRLARSFGGRSKGFGYVEFESASSVAAALRQDRIVLSGRPMYVSECRKEGEIKPAVSMRFSTGMEKSKLFIKNLSFSVTEQQVKEFFSQFGKVVGCRLVTQKSGAPKGLAFVDYETEGEATAAVMKTDGEMLQGKPLSVAISNPPPRKPPMGAKPEYQKALGGGKRDMESFSRPRTQLFLQPRSVSTASSSQSSANKRPGPPARMASGVPPTGAEAPISSEAPASSDAPTSSDTTAQQPAGNMSNQDFRAMLLKK